MKNSSRPDTRPSFQFYPDDWLEESSLKLVSLAARGLWIEMLSRMWKSPKRGVLLQANLSKVEAHHLAAWCGRPEAEVKQALSELEAFGVFSTDENGTPYSRRQVREEKQRLSKVEAGRAGGLKQKPSRRLSRTKANRGSSSSSSTSSSTSLNQKTVPSPADEPPAVDVSCEQPPEEKAMLTDADREAPYRRWLLEAKTTAPTPVVETYDRELREALDLYYERRGGRLTPTRIGEIGRALSKAGPADNGLLAIEVFVDNHAGDKDHKYLIGIIRRLAKLTEDQFEAETTRHRSRQNGSGVWSAAKEAMRNAKA